MDEKEMILQPGTDLKFRVTAVMEGLNLDDCHFVIAIRNAYGRMKYLINKSRCYKDSEGQYYFTMEQVQEGTYSAFFVGSIADDDYNKQVRKITDHQCLCVVGEKDYLKHHTVQHAVIYEQIWTVNLDDGTYLADKNGKLILTADGRRISFAANV